MSNPFDYVNAINSHKDIIRQSDNPDLSEKLYSPYHINKAMSYFAETILYANQMNFHHTIDKKLQNDYYLNTIRVGKRYAKWHKKDDNDNVDCIQEYYKVSYNRAVEILKVLTQQQVDLIKTKIIKGGINNELRLKHARGGET
jgi:hypothetical protein